MLLQARDRSRPADALFLSICSTFLPAGCPDSQDEPSRGGWSSLLLILLLLRPLPFHLCFSIHHAHAHAKTFRATDSARPLPQLSKKVRAKLGSSKSVHVGGKVGQDDVSNGILTDAKKKFEARQKLLAEQAAAAKKQKVAALAAAKKARDAKAAATPNSVDGVHLDAKARKKFKQTLAEHALRKKANKNAAATIENDIAEHKLTTKGIIAAVKAAEANQIKQLNEGLKQQTDDLIVAKIKQLQHTGAKANSFALNNALTDVEKKELSLKNGQQAKGPAPSSASQGGWGAARVARGRRHAGVQSQNRAITHATGGSKGGNPEGMLSSYDQQILSGGASAVLKEDTASSAPQYSAPQGAQQLSQVPRAQYAATPYPPQQQQQQQEAYQAPPQYQQAYQQPAPYGYAPEQQQYAAPQQPYQQAPYQQAYQQPGYYPPQQQQQQQQYAPEPPQNGYPQQQMYQQPAPSYYGQQPQQQYQQPPQQQQLSYPPQQQYAPQYPQYPQAQGPPPQYAEYQQPQAQQLYQQPPQQPLQQQPAYSPKAPSPAPAQSEYGESAALSNQGSVSTSAGGGTLWKMFSSGISSPPDSSSSSSGLMDGGGGGGVNLPGLSQSGSGLSMGGDSGGSAGVEGGGGGGGGGVPDPAAFLGAAASTKTGSGKKVSPQAKAAIKAQMQALRQSIMGDFKSTMKIGDEAGYLPPPPVGR